VTRRHELIFINTSTDLYASVAAYDRGTAGTAGLRGKQAQQASGESRHSRPPWLVTYGWTAIDRSIEFRIHKKSCFLNLRSMLHRTNTIIWAVVSNQP